MCIKIHNVVPEPYMYLNSSYWDRSNVILYYQLYHHYCVKESLHVEINTCTLSVTIGWLR